MKLHISSSNPFRPHLWFAIGVLALTAPLAFAQDDLKPEKKAPPAVEQSAPPQPPSEIVLAPGLLPAVIEQMEAIYSQEMVSKGMTEEKYRAYRLPTILYGPGTEELMVAAPLRMRDVWPVDALTLIAAAVGCELEPIYPIQDPPQGDPFDAREDHPRVIGFRISLSHPPVSSRQRTQPGGLGFDDGEQPIARNNGGYRQDVPPQARAMQLIDELEATLKTLRAEVPQDNPVARQLQARLSALAGPFSASDPDALSGIGLALTQDEDEVIRIGQIIPDSPAERSGVIHLGDRLLKIAQEGQDFVDVTGMKLAEAVRLVRGRPGTNVRMEIASAEGPENKREVELTRQTLKLQDPGPKDPVPQVFIMSPAGVSVAGDNPTRVRVPSSSLEGTPRRENHALAHGPMGMARPAMADAPPAPKEPYVRVYALGSLLKGDEKEAASKEDEFHELITAALEMAEQKGEAVPQLSFHTSSKTLIALASDEQHNIIEEVLRTLVENTNPPSANPFR